MLLLTPHDSLISAAQAERIKDLATIAGVRNNQLVGYGIVVGLDGTGDQTSQAPFTTQSLINMLGNLGVTIPPGTTLQLKNVAAVMVTMQMPPFAQPGQQFDITVSSMANAKSLKGGTLLMTPLKGVDGQIYAIAQGNLIVGGAGGSAGGARTQINQLSAGRIPAGATVERAVPTAVGSADHVLFELATADFGTAQRVADAINIGMGETMAWPLDGRRIQVRAPQVPYERVAFLGRVENLEVTPITAAARVTVNSRTGSVVMNQNVSLLECAIAHGNLTVTVNTETQVSQPNPLAAGQTVVAQAGQVDIKQDQSSLMRFKPGVTLTEVVKALNAVGATPMDLINILQAMKAAGALRAELEVI
ncbi:flagellar basal body P-ring protein FlgI [Uliginosibacterium sp. 31-16]|uniref:flagellar basal body P-ring protein FlgI n=1 Tax=Uliginosibacterium sp. 31-16 TaxID=3068315 RepID=UPI00273DD336|nr:flagellar basal body P-ring protein FlgI [Uliginosibacterium sp. 31-16]MDP5240627.1 flagellar basal body P-ring protein FlgI [Uliginosibacterium sp. 31-16]